MVHTRALHSSVRLNVTVVCECRAELQCEGGCTRLIRLRGIESVTSTRKGQLSGFTKGDTEQQQFNKHYNLCNWNFIGYYFLYYLFLADILFMTQSMQSERNLGLDKFGFRHNCGAQFIECRGFY